MADNVNHPAHYAPKYDTRPLECIDITRHMSFLLGNAFKYVWRAGDKGDNDKAVEDLNKAEFYLRDANRNELMRTNDIAKYLFEQMESDGSTRYYALRNIVYGEFEQAMTLIEHMKKDFADAH